MGVIVFIRTGRQIMNLHTMLNILRGNTLVKCPAIDWVALTLGSMVLPFLVRLNGEKLYA